MYRGAIGNFRKIAVPNPDNFEVMPVIGSVRGSSRKLAIVAAYIPPNYPVARGRACLDYIEQCVLEIKNKYRDP